MSKAANTDRQISSATVTIGGKPIGDKPNSEEASGYPDCRPEYVEAFQKMANLATRAGVEGRNYLKIHTPLITLSKADTIRRGAQLGVDYSLTSSCYDPSALGEPCRECDSCLLRAKGFAEAVLLDRLVQKFGGQYGTATTI